MLASGLIVVAGLLLCVGMVVFARRKPGYRHGRDTISELGEIGAPDQHAVAYGWFLPIGLLMAFAGILLVDVDATVAALAACIGVGYLVAVVFPCDPGSPLSGSLRQAIHNLGGGIQYIGGGFALLTFARDGGVGYQVAGFVVLGAAVALTVLPAGSPRGFVQRIAEACLFGAAAMTAWQVAGDALAAGAFA